MREREGGGGRETEKARARARERQSETDRQTDRQTDREFACVCRWMVRIVTHSRTHKQINSLTERERDLQIRAGNALHRRMPR